MLKRFIYIGLIAMLIISAGCKEVSSIGVDTVSSEVSVDVSSSVSDVIEQEEAEEVDFVHADFLDSIGIGIKALAVDETINSASGDPFISVRYGLSTDRTIDNYCDILKGALGEPVDTALNPEILMGNSDMMDEMRSKNFFNCWQKFTKGIDNQKTRDVHIYLVYDNDDSMYLYIIG